MLRQLTRLFLLASMICGVRTALGFSLLGPINEAWQAPEIAYGIGGDVGAPKLITEEYRRNTPVLYYTMDVNFIDYFGTNGMKAIDDAFAVFNSLTNVSSYSRDLTEFPLAFTRENYQASALGLLDIKSVAMKVIIEQLGLAEPERFVWTLHDRFDRQPGPCPLTMEYLVVKRNYDIVPNPVNQVQSSSYVNGTLYSYYITENCQPPPVWLADAIEFAVDPLDLTYTAVASGFGPVIDALNPQIALPGFFYTGLTRDDVGGLRYLLKNDNFNWEDPGSGTFSVITNTTPQIVFSSNLTQFAAQALTNTAGTLQALYPGLVITGSTNFFRTVWVTNVVPFFTNSPFDPALSPPRLRFATNRFLAIENLFEHTFDNLVAAIFTNNQWVAVPIRSLTDFTNAAVASLQTITVNAAQSPFAPAGTFVPVTNLTSTVFSTNTVVGEFIILPTNACELVILAPQLTLTNFLTNIIASVTNTIPFSNAVTVTNIDVVFVQQVVQQDVTHAFLALPVSCVQSNIVLAGGVERIRFERRDFDSLIGRFFQPFTNTYSLDIITNNVRRPMRVQRPVFGPDILIAALDFPLTPGPGADPTTLSASLRNIVFNTNGLPFYVTPSGTPGGPGTIEGPMSWTLNKGGPIYFNQDPFAYDRLRAEISQLLMLNWGSYDGSTNPPVVYPNGETLTSLENYYLMQISPGLLPEGSVGQEFAEVNFTVLGGRAPYRWALAPGSPGLPPGLTLSPAGLLSGTPSTRGTYDFTIRMTDATGRFVDRAYMIKINW